MFSLGFFTRMLFSCLVDADYLDTESFYDSEKSVTRWALPQEDLNKLRSLLKSFISQKQATAKPSKVNEARHRILTRCISEAKGPQGFYSLTVPTGGGKTLSSLSFALEHAAVHDLSRVIYAIPFTSIIEQNAQVFRQAIGDPNVLEHHCNYHTWGHSTSIISNRLRGLATENWAAPVVVTTNVQFFESLYNNKPSRCRKLHNISGSVIILDEAQAIPTEFIEPCLLVLRELAANYRCTILFCTATQPALDNVRLKRLNLPNTRELVDEPDKLFEELERTRVEFIGKMTGDELARQLDKHQQALCIVSTKKQAQQVFVLIQEDEGSFHLSTNMYPVHRLRVLSAIRQRLADGLSCRVVSTSLVEAGVDFDFPVVYRAIAGLDSIAQAAGRCNREGLADYGLVYVYEPEELPAMPWLRRRISRAQETLRALPTENCLNPVSMHRYFELLYDVESLDAKDITKRMNPKLHPELIIPFQEVARDFRLIEDEGAGVIMPGLPEDRDEIHRLVEKLRHSQYPQSEGRILQRYAVAVRNMSFMNLQQKGVIELIHDAYPVMLNANAYDQNMGLLENMAELWDPEYLFL
ncbi:CRISPR-associated helicase, Cas3 family [Desulfofustis glycolicus DSM 9705]|uniref:CRISPR-associated helicase, Cas3 family n=2 Tax=Desulfofustis glycolicus TaxID=51195 RepID=A0A1M5WRF2_9BACT|nr:CRISPR-associated helicase, Cas3 family [Desulfofustis glycolicus DSM 9705]